MKFVIIGGNASGMSTATKLRKNMPDASIIVLEKYDIVSFGACGLPYYLADEFSDENELIARSADSFKKSNIDIKLFHEAISINKDKKEVVALDTKTGDKHTFEYDKLVISTGASPIKPNIAGIDLENVHTLTKLEDGITIKQKLKNVNNVAIIGAGFIGLETAEAMLHLGKNVVLIEKMHRVSERVFDKEITDKLEESMAKHERLTLKTNEGLVEILGDTKVQAIKTDKGEYKADLVIVSIGFVPQTSFCKDLGFDLLPNGALIIDENCKTSILDIYAAGDCASVQNIASGENTYIPLATTANKLGRLLGDTLAGKDAPFQGTLGSCAIRFMDFELAKTGLTEDDCKRLGINYSTNFITDYNHTSYVPKNRGQVHVKLIYNKDSRILLGGQIAGVSDAVLRINALSVAIFSKMTVDTIGMMDFVYSPPFARTWDILNISGNTAK